MKSLSGAIALQADLKDEKSCRAMVDEAAKRLGRLDILVNNAGMNVRKQPQEYTLDEWKLVMDTNLTSAFVASQAAYPHLKKAGGGKIVNIGSMMSIFGASFTAPYAREQGRHRADDARPGHRLGARQHPGQRGAAGLDRHRPDARARAATWRACTSACSRARPPAAGASPSDLSGIAVFLCSPASDFVTGTAIPVDGGYSVQG